MQVVMMEPIKITGAGIISAIGNNLAETLKALQKGQTGIGQME